MYVEILESFNFKKGSEPDSEKFKDTKL